MRVRGLKRLKTGETHNFRVSRGYIQNLGRKTVSLATIVRKAGDGWLTGRLCHPFPPQRIGTTGGGLLDHRGLQAGLKHVLIPGITALRLCGSDGFTSLPHTSQT